jgi:hypothetical protein
MTATYTPTAIYGVSKVKTENATAKFFSGPGAADKNNTALFGKKTPRCAYDRKCLILDYVRSLR